MSNKTLFLTLLSYLLFSNVISAADTETLHFHVVKKQGDSRHISVIPSRGYLANGKVKNNYNPNSIVYQQRNLLKRLEAEQAELDRPADDEQKSNTFSNRALPKSNTDIIRTPGNNGVLQDLIDLEKRGGKVNATN